MNRRSLMQSIGGAGLLSAIAGAPLLAQQSERKTRLYRLEYIYLKQGDQAERVNKFLSSQAPLLSKNSRALGVFGVQVAPHIPTTIVLTGYAGFEDMEAADERVRKDPGYQSALEELEKGTEPPYEYIDQVLLRPTEFSPEIVPLAEKPKTPRVWELRVYHSPTQRQLRGVHERFGGPEIPIFHRVGIHPILFADTLIGPNMPNMTYLMPFASLADREKAWEAFGSDPAWIKARKDSVDRGGQIVARSNISLLRAAAYSPIQ